MKVGIIFNNAAKTSGYCEIEREKGDVKFRDSGWGTSESRFLHHVKQVLNKQGYDFIKKRMWKDGHLVDSDQQYLRERKGKKGRLLAIYNDHHAIRYAAQDFNEDGTATLTVRNLLDFLRFKQG